MEVASASQKEELANLMEITTINPTEKINKVLSIFRDCKVDEWAVELKEKYVHTAIETVESQLAEVNKVIGQSFLDNVKPKE